MRIPKHVARQEPLLARFIYVVCSIALVVSTYQCATTERSEQNESRRGHQNRSPIPPIRETNAEVANQVTEVSIQRSLIEVKAASQQLRGAMDLWLKSVRQEHDAVQRRLEIWRLLRQNQCQKPDLRDCHYGKGRTP